MPNREKLQIRAVDDISIKYFDPYNILCAEYPTGSGKTKILLDSAMKIMHKQDTSVIISTSNNALVYAFMEEAKKHNFDIDDIKITIGKKNYVDREKIYDTLFLNQAGLTKEEIEKYLAQKEETLSNDFINHFKLPSEYEELIQQDDDSIYTTLEERREEIAQNKKVYITNHHYLISLYRTLTEEHDFASLPILADEAHELYQAAQTIFMVSFSPYRMSMYLNALIRIDESILKQKDIKTIIAAKNYAQKLKDYFITHKAERLIFIKEIKRFAESEEIKKIKGILSIIIKKKKISLKTKKIVSVLNKELNELNNIKYKQDEQIEIAITPVKKYPSIQVITEDASYLLRNFMWKKNKGYLALVSGTFCISENDRKEDNMWSFLRLGFFPFNDTGEDERKARWNDRIKLNFIFKVEPPIFLQNQARFYIAEGERFNPPAHDVKNEVEKLTIAWIESCAKEIVENLLYKNVVILMSSFENCELLNEALMRYDDRVLSSYKIFYSSPTTTIKQLQDKYMTAIDEGQRCILIGNLSFYTGIDLPHHYLNTLIIGKLPFEPENKYLTRHKIANNISRILNNRFKAILLFRQGLGRSLRSETDKAFIAVLDPRIKKNRNSAFLHFLERMAERI